MRTQIEGLAFIVSFSFYHVTYCAAAAAITISIAVVQNAKDLLCGNCAIVCSS